MITTPAQTPTRETDTRDARDLKAKLFRGFADPARLAILEALRDGPHAVGELVDATGLSQPNVSNHLACLKDCGLVTGERNGRQVIYALSDPRVEKLLAATEDLLADVAQGLPGCPAYAAPEGATRG